MMRSTRKRVSTKAAAVLAAAVVVAGSGGALAFGTSQHSSPEASSSSSGTISTKGFPSGLGAGGAFVDRCGFAHEAADDPILMPGMKDMSMQHDFFGNVTTNQSSTAKSLVGKTTKCGPTADASAYWAPVLYQHGKALTPKSTLIYWQETSAKDSKIVAPPAGLQMIAGNEKATSPQPTSVVRWSCAGVPGNASNTPHSCTGAQLKVTIPFPNCWNGHTLSGANQTNVVYENKDRTCPSSHPVVIPRIVFHLTYPTSSASGLSLSMSPTMHGSVDTMHADFINGWNQSTMKSLVGACLTKDMRCGPVGKDGVPNGPRPKQLTKLENRKGGLFGNGSNESHASKAAAA